MFEQFYYTRCSAEESVIGPDGFSIRAASVPVEEIKSREFDVLYDLAIYKLPVGMWKQARSDDGLPVGNAPIRLARIQTPDGNLALVHSVYRADAGIRKMSYFSHVVLVPAHVPTVTACQSVALWGSQGAWGSKTGWVWQESSEIDVQWSKALPKWAPPAVESHNLISDKSVRLFLRGKAVSVPTNCPALNVSPKRLHGDEHRSERRSLIQAILAAFLRREQVFLIAEPGLSALIVYALTTLLPEELVDSLTFSTYEPPDRFISSSANIVSTVDDPDSDTEGSFSRKVHGGLLINSHNLVTVPRSVEADLSFGYAHYAVDLLLQNSLAELHAFWEVSRNIANGQELTATCFLHTWEMYDRLARLESDPLSDEELDNYLDDPRWRRQLFGRPAGRIQAVDSAVRPHDDIPLWWPTGSQDKTNLEPLRSSIMDIRELIIDRVVHELEQIEHSNEHFDTAEYYLAALLPGVTDQTYTREHASSEIVKRLEAPGDGHRLSRRLPWTTRRMIVLELSKLANSTVDHHGAWLHLARVEELVAICGEPIQDEWKTRAVLMWLSSHSTCDGRIVKMLLDDERLLNLCFHKLGKNLPDRVARVREILLKMFKGASTPHEIMRLCIALLQTDLLAQNDQLRQPCEQVLLPLSEKESPWHLLFVEDTDYDKRLGKFLGTDNRTLTQIWAAASRSLNKACIYPSHEQHNMLLALIEKNKRREIMWTDDTESSKQTLDQWSQVYSALYHDPPTGAGWHALRWSMESLEIDDPRLLGHLIDRITSSGRYAVRDLGEVVDCAKLMLPRHCPVAVLAEKLMKATECISETKRQAVQVALLADACQGSVASYKELLAKMKNTLPKEVLAGLEANRNALLQKPTSVDKSIAEKVRRKTFLNIFALPLGLTAVSFIALLVLLLSHPDTFPRQRSNIILGILLLCSLAIAIVQSWRNFKRETQNSNQPGQIAAPHGRRSFRWFPFRTGHSKRPSSAAKLTMNFGRRENESEGP